MKKLKDIIAIAILLIPFLVIGQIGQNPSKFHNGIETDSIGGLDGDKIHFLDEVVFKDIQEKDTDSVAVFDGEGKFGFTLREFIAESIIVEDIAALEAYEGEATTLFVKDSLRGGMFNYEPSGLTVDDGVIFDATGKGSGYWQRQVDNSLYIEWFGTNDGVSFQKAIDFVESGNQQFTIKTKSKEVVIDTTVTLNVNNYNIEMYNAFIKPSSTFSGTTLMNIQGVYDAAAIQSLSFEMKFDGIDDTDGLTGIEMAVKIDGGNHKYYFANLNIGLHVKGATEKQRFFVNGSDCGTLVLNDRKAPTDPPTDVTPDENFFNIGGGKCDTFFHDAPNSGGSYQAIFNVENSRGNGYAVILEGTKLAKLSGEIRGVQDGGVYINNTALTVDFDGLHLYSVQSGLALEVESANAINGSFYTENGNDDAIWLKQVVRGGILNLGVIRNSNGYGLQIGNPSTTQRVEGMSINYNVSMNNPQTSLDINKMRHSQLTMTEASLSNSNNITLRGTILDSNIFLPSQYLNFDMITESIGTNTSNFIFTNSTTTELNAFTPPFEGMKVKNVIDKNNAGAYYNGTKWVYESDNNINSKAVTVGHLNEDNIIVNPLLSGDLKTQIGNKIFYFGSGIASKPVGLSTGGTAKLTTYYNGSGYFGNLFVSGYGDEVWYANRFNNNYGDYYRVASREWFTTDDIVIGGNKEFSNPVTIADATADDEAVNLGQVNDTLSNYTPTASLAAVALSNDYNDLDNKPTVPVPTLLEVIEAGSTANAPSTTFTLITDNFVVQGAEVNGRNLSDDGSKLDGIEAGAEVNVNADWNASSGDAEILNKPALGTMATESTNDYYTKTQVNDTLSYYPLYEEGTWSGNFVTSDTGTTPTGTQNYIKVGNQVTIYVNWTGDLSGLVGVISVDGLPTFGGTIPNGSSTIVVHNAGISYPTDATSLIVRTNANHALFRFNVDDGSYINMTEANITGTTHSISFTLTYRIEP